MVTNLVNGVDATVNYLQCPVFLDSPLKIHNENINNNVPDAQIVHCTGVGTVYSGNRYWISLENIINEVRR